MNASFSTNKCIKRALIIWTVLTSAACSSDKPTLGIIMNDGSEGACADLKEMVSDVASVNSVHLSGISHLDGSDVIWYDRRDSSAFSAEEISMWNDFLEDYVSEGGHLILSMDAVRLLNAWGVEPNEIQSWEYECIDEGFGRKVGSHARLYHPLYEGLHGGAYTWHGTEDNVCRVNGFLGDSHPAAEGSQVIGCQWEYVFLRPEKKVVWETPYGKGSILAVGGFFYLGKDNFDRAILETFSENCVRYEAGMIVSSDTTRFWESAKPEVIALHRHHDEVCRACAADYSPIMIQAPRKMGKMPEGPVLRRQATDEYTDVISPHSMAIMKEKGGIDEIWTHPFLAIRDFRVWVMTRRTQVPVCLSSLVPEIDIYPYGIARNYSLDGVWIREVISSSPDKMVTVVHYEWEGDDLVKIFADFKSNLRMMWPYDENVLGSIFYSWSPELNATVFRDETGRYVSAVGANIEGHPVISGRYDTFTYDGGMVRGEVTSLLQAGAVVAYEPEGMQSMDFIFSSSSSGEDEMLSSYAEVASNPESVLISSAARYSQWLDSTISIESPDEEFNEAVIWAKISCAQFITETPGLGTGLTAGYASSRRGWGGNHRVSGRPGYAWYFGRDSEWASFAFADMGDFATVRNNIELLLKFQSPDGKIYHELTTSGIVHYDAADATPLLLPLTAHYLRLSGDIDFVKKHYASLKKAMSYCFTTDRDGDFLIENANVGHGWLEGGSLWGFQTEFYLCGIWKAALESAAYIAEKTGHGKDASMYGKVAQKVTAPLENFWNEDKGWYNWALNEDDSYQDDFLVLTAVPVYFGVLDDSRSRSMAAKYVGPLLSTDWGSRTVYETSNANGGGAYHPRHVWPLFTGWKSLAEYKEGFYTQGFASLRGSLETYKSFSLGHIAEVINGDSYCNNGITQHQCWSETMTLMPLIEGMLGYSADALAGRVNIAPRIPADWDTLKVSGLKAGDRFLSMKYHRTRNLSEWTLTGGAGLLCGFTPAFPAGTEILSVEVNGKGVDWHVMQNESSVEVNVEMKLTGEDQIAVTMKPGPAVIPILTKPSQGAASTGFRLISEKCDGKKYEAVLSGRPGSVHTVSLRTWGEYRVSEGGIPMKLSEEGILPVTVSFPQSESEPYVYTVLKLEK